MSATPAPFGAEGPRIDLVAGRFLDIRGPGRTADARVLSVIVREDGKTDLVLQCDRKTARLLDEWDRLGCATGFDFFPVSGRGALVFFPVPAVASVSEEDEDLHL